MPRPRRSNLSQRSRNAIRLRNIANQLTDEERQIIRQERRVRTARSRALQTQEQREAARETARLETRNRRANQQRESLRSARRNTSRPSSVDLNQASFLYDCTISDSSHPFVCIGPMDIVCEHCGALKFAGESPKLCCNGLIDKVKLPLSIPPPEPLNSLLRGETPESRHDEKYNGCFQMTSFGAEIPEEHGINPTFEIENKSSVQFSTVNTQYSITCVPIKLEPDNKEEYINIKDDHLDIEEGDLDIHEVNLDNKKEALDIKKENYDLNEEYVKNNLNNFTYDIKIEPITSLDKSIQSDQKEHGVEENLECFEDEKVKEAKILGIRKIKKPKRNFDTKSYSCDICNKIFHQSNNLKRHKATHSSDKPYSCDICNKKYGRSDYLKTHKITHTTDKPYNCDICNKKFSRSNSLKIHKRTHNGNKPHSCDICNKKFSECCSLKKHKRTHTGERPYTCDICNKKFSQSNSLRKHKRTHTSDKPYSCDICNKKYSRSDHLKIHKATHTGDKPYSCDICNKKFSRSDYLKLHKSTHTGDKPYNCDLCDKKFSRSHSLKNHKRAHNDIVSKDKNC